MRKILLTIQRFLGAWPQKDLNGLIQYIKQGDISALQYWTKTAIAYKYDRWAGDSWEPIDQVIKRGYSDCEEKACINSAVISRWPGYKAYPIVLGHPNPDRCHAICYFESPDKCGVMDDSGLKLYNKDTSISCIVMERWPGMKYWVKCYPSGIPSEDRIYL